MFDSSFLDTHFRKQRLYIWVALFLKLVDFDMSRSTLSLLTDEGKIFVAGQGRHLNLKQMHLPPSETQSVVKVGASENSYYFITPNGRVYSNFPINERAKGKFFRKQKLYMNELMNIPESQLLNISGKYETVVASLSLGEIKQ